MQVDRLGLPRIHDASADGVRDQATDGANVTLFSPKAGDFLRIGVEYNEKIEPSLMISV